NEIGDEQRRTDGDCGQHGSAHSPDHRLPSPRGRCPAHRGDDSRRPSLKSSVCHLTEYIQADIWVRFQRMRGNEVHFVCADDAHGAPIMIAADKAGKTPKQFIAEIAATRKPMLDGFEISFDNWHSTDGPENH